MQTRIFVLAVLISIAPLFAEAAGAPRTFRELASDIVEILSAGVATLLGLGIVIYVWGIASNMIKLGEGDPTAYRSYILWGIIILFVMVSVWGILNLIRQTIFQNEGNYSMTLQAKSTHWYVS